MSLKTALETLGFTPCHHMSEIFTQPRQIDLWARVGTDDPPDWSEVFADYPATTDFPGCIFWRELLEENPDAKVILTLRDPDSWYTSVMDTIYQFAKSVPWWLRVVPAFARHLRTVDRLVWQGVFDGRIEDAEHAKTVYEQHNQAVVAGVDPQQLLVFRVGEGWEPLCRFLSVPVPEGPFPRLNDTKRIRRMLTAMRTVSVLIWVVLVGVGWIVLF